MDTRRLLPSLVSVVGFLLFANVLRAQSAPSGAAIARALRHQSEDWRAIEEHLPDPKTATPERLELQGDVLRARRFEEDALEYYQYAIDRGGDVPRLLNRMGITELTMMQPSVARPYFAKVVALKPKEAGGWNNLGATEYFIGNYKGSLGAYLKAVKLEKRNAVFRSNLATAYFQLKDYESANKEFAKAYKLDHNVFHPDGSTGIQARVLSATERGRFCFELARVAAKSRDDVAVLAWLTKSSEAGFDIAMEMGQTRDLEEYRRDPRVSQIIQTAKALRAKRTVAAVAVPVLPSADATKPN